MNVVLKQIRIVKTQTHRISSALQWLDEHPVRLCFFLALLLNFMVECLSRRSIVQSLVQLITQPYLFFLGALLVFFTLSISLLTPKRYFTLTLISLVWLGLGIGNFVLLSYRVTPLAAIDFALFTSVFSIIGVYLNLWQIILICAAFVVALGLLVLLALRTPKRKINWKRALPASLGAILLAAALIGLGRYSGALPNAVGNLADAYNDYGFTLCFCSSVFDRGIDRPAEYEEEIRELATEVVSKPKLKPNMLEDEKRPEDLTPETSPEQAHPMAYNESAVTPEQAPNVIFLQLESFIDPKQIVKYDYSEDPCPTFTRLKTLFPSGYLTVPSIGAGTANTEFEVITGMSLQFFGTGEYPYKTVLRDNTCETIAYNLAERNYSATAIHNNKATFYDRHEVFSKLGFDRFIALEYMNNVRFNAQSWARDEVLTEVILDTLKTTEQSDVIYTISVQGHGRYPDEPVPGGNGEIRVLGEEDPVMLSRMEYYVNQLAEMDDFLLELLTELKEYEEPVVLVMYGDHLPAMELTDADMVNEDLFQTEYVIWSNYGLKAEDADLHAYQLSAHVMELLGYDNGVLTKFHQENAMNRQYLRDLEMLEYDMLYGDRVVYGGKNPYKATDITLGLHPIKIRSVGMLGKTLYVFGENFTPYSVVCINGRQQHTQFMSPDSLCVPNVDFTEAHSICVEQVSEEMEVLSETAPYMIQ